VSSIDQLEKVWCNGKVSVHPPTAISRCEKD